MKQNIIAQNAPAAIGPYSHAVCANGFVFASGQLGIDPATGKLARDIESQTRQAIENLINVLQASGAALEDVVKTTVFVQDLTDFSKINALYAERFGGSLPARSCVEVAALPAGALVEIEAIACVKG